MSHYEDAVSLTSLVARIPRIELAVRVAFSVTKYEVLV